MKTRMPATTPEIQATPEVTRGARDLGSNADRQARLQSRSQETDGANDNDPDATPQRVDPDAQPLYLYGTACETNITPATCGAHGFTPNTFYKLTPSMMNLRAWGQARRLSGLQEVPAPKSEQVTRVGGQRDYLSVEGGATVDWPSGPQSVDFRMEEAPGAAPAPTLIVSNNGALALTRMAAAAWKASSHPMGSLDVFCHLELGGDQDEAASRRNGFVKPATEASIQDKVRSSMDEICTALSGAVNANVGTGWPFGRGAGYFPDASLRTPGTHPDRPDEGKVTDLATRLDALLGGLWTAPVGNVRVLSALQPIQEAFLAMVKDQEADYTTGEFKGGSTFAAQLMTSVIRDVRDHLHYEDETLPEDMRLSMEATMRTWLDNALKTVSTLAGMRWKEVAVNREAADLSPRTLPTGDEAAAEDPLGAVTYPGE